MHEHNDYIGGAYMIVTKFNIPAWASHGTHRVAENLYGADRTAMHFCRTDGMFCIGGLWVLPCTVPHDAHESLQFALNDGARRLDVLTDADMLTEHLCAHLAGMHILVLECNYDREMLANSAYLWSLRRRISGDFGHLANDVTTVIFMCVCHDTLHTVVAAHLSEQNSTPLSAVKAIAVPLGTRTEDMPIVDRKESPLWYTV